MARDDGKRPASDKKSVGSSRRAERRPAGEPPRRPPRRERSPAGSRPRGDRRDRVNDIPRRSSRSERLPSSRASRGGEERRSTERVGLGSSKQPMEVEAAEGSSSARFTSANLKRKKQVDSQYEMRQRELPAGKWGATQARASKEQSSKFFRTSTSSSSSGGSLDSSDSDVKAPSDDDDARSNDGWELPAIMEDDALMLYVPASIEDAPAVSSVAPVPAAAASPTAPETSSKLAASVEVPLACAPQPPPAPSTLTEPISPGKAVPEAAPPLPVASATLLESVNPGKAVLEVAPPLPAASAPIVQSTGTMSGPSSSTQELATGSPPLPTQPAQEVSPGPPILDLPRSTFPERVQAGKVLTPLRHIQQELRQGLTNTEEFVVYLDETSSAWALAYPEPRPAGLDTLIFRVQGLATRLKSSGSAQEPLRSFLQRADAAYTEVVADLKTVEGNRVEVENRLQSMASQRSHWAAQVAELEGKLEAARKRQGELQNFEETASFRLHMYDQTFSSHQERTERLRERRDAVQAELERATQENSQDAEVPPDIAMILSYPDGA
ncbi:hypothetical protein EJB05_05117, partial [Eragrostis curvula]